MQFQRQLNQNVSKRFLYLLTLEKIRNISLKYGADTFKLRSSKYTKDKTTLLDLMSYECKE